MKSRMQYVHPVLLAGGSGKRLWPLSRKSYPKQFSNLIGENTLFQQAAIRSSLSKTIQFAPHIILTNANFRFIVAEQLLTVGIDPGPILIEPEAKNTAAAILAASIFAYSRDKTAILIVAPSDHVITDTDDFHEAILTGLSALDSEKMITFGIKPTRPETGYGYLEIKNKDFKNSALCDVERFIEKPDHTSAKKMVKAGNFLWNSGIFLFKAASMIEAFKIYASNTFIHVSEAVSEANLDLGFLRLASKPWSRLENISIDYAIMEKAKNLVAVTYSSKWSDLGGWDAVWAESVKDKAGNVTSDSAHAIDCSNSMLRSESDNQQIVGLGIQNIIAIAMQDAVLVAHKNYAQEVKEVVDLLKINKIPQAEIFPIDHRPWGWFESLALGQRFQVKRITVKPSGALSLQSHNHRSEHWIVVEGNATVTIEKNVRLVKEGESVYIPQGAIHRLENEGKSFLVLIEVQIGSYLGEDDIIRYEDIYSRDSRK